MCTDNDTNVTTVDPATDAAGDAATDAGSVAKVERDEVGKLVVHMTGLAKPIVDAKVVRYFPWSLPDAYISIRDDGREVIMLKTLDELDEVSRAIVVKELADKIFNPKILQVLQVKREFGISSISAVTDRGEIYFQFHGRDDVRLLSPTRALFRDVDGNTFELPDITETDAVTQKLLRRYF